MNSDNLTGPQQRPLQAGPTEHSAGLMRAFNFTPADLAMNRAGKFSRDQTQMLQAMAATARRRPRQILLIVVVAFAALCGLLFAQPIDPSQRILALGVCAAAMSLVVALSLLNLRFASNIERTSVAAVEGIVDLSPTVTTGVWHARVANVGFQIASLDTSVFVSGVSYRVYYCRLGRRPPAILSVEVISVGGRTRVAHPMF